jgi:hypothetical protein
MVKKAIIIVLAIGIAAAATYLFWQYRAEQTASRQAVQAERDALQRKAQDLEKKLSQLERGAAELAPPPFDTKKMSAAFGETPAETQAEPGEPEQPGMRITNFFSYLDQKGYLKNRGIDMQASAYFRLLVGRLKESRPVISGETQDLYMLLKNITYFFRILGKDSVLAIKDIMQGEDEIVEPTAELLFAWINPWNATPDPERPVVEPTMAYDYAAFFLQTIAGQSYLYRRTSKIRCLVTYYSILVLDKANDDNLNRYGIDIRPHIDNLTREIQSHRQLANAGQYLARLSALKEKERR